MENDENTQDPYLEEEVEETEVVEETTTEDEDSTESTPKEDSEVKVSPAEYRHFKKWQSQKGKDTQPQETVSKTASPQPSVEETVLLAQGMDEGLLGELKTIAQVRGTTLLKAQNDPIFVAVKEKFEKDQRTKNASVGSARGAGSIKARKDFATPGLSKEEHMKMVKDTL